VEGAELVTDDPETVPVTIPSVRERTPPDDLLRGFSCDSLLWSPRASRSSGCAPWDALPTIAAASRAHCLTACWLPVTPAATCGAENQDGTRLCRATAGCWRTTRRWRRRRSSTAAASGRCRCPTSSAASCTTTGDSGDRLTPRQPMSAASALRHSWISPFIEGLGEMLVAVGKPRTVQKASPCRSERA